VDDPSTLTFVLPGLAVRAMPLEYYVSGIERDLYFPAHAPNE
jgi:hypothetical protein